MDQTEPGFTIFNPFGASTQDFVVHIGDWFLWIPAALAVIAILTFFWGAIVYMGANLKESEKETGRESIISGSTMLLELFVLWVIIHGVVYLFS